MSLEAPETSLLVNSRLVSYFYSSYRSYYCSAKTGETTEKGFLLLFLVKRKLA
jgi:hypothetical protein